jgi:AcrR family transcriptional regulator
MSSAPATPSERRRSQQRSEARRAILEAAEALLLEEGLESFSIRRLASRCGYTAPTIYHHFGDKQGLLDAALEERLRMVLERLRGVRRSRDPAQTVRAILLEFVHFGLEDPSHHRLLNLPRPPDAPPLRVAEEVEALFREQLALLAAAGRLRAGDVDEAVQFAWMLIYGLVALRLGRPDVEWKGSIVDFSLDAALRGLVGPEGHRPRDGRQVP